MLKKIFLGLLILIFVFLGVKYKGRINNNMISDNAPREEASLVLFEEFNGAVDKSVWDIWDWAVTLEGEKNLFYTPDDVYVENGNLVIRSRQNQNLQKYQGRLYTSGKITLKDVVKYGEFEIRAKLPKGQGIHPAFWLSGANRWPPEIDIFELIGHEPNKIFFTNHFKDGFLRKHRFEQESYISQEDFSKGYHIFKLSWMPNEIRWYVDGILRYQTNENVPNEPMILILNTAASSAWAGMPNETTIFPQFFLIDYIKIYSFKQ